ncbi:MAG: hypothetical protein HY693_01855 [Deltaproteobacteria bacterium]|nr:hypothetical protein [Deltaproteobacteria bacterium]
MSQVKKIIIYFDHPSISLSIDDLTDYLEKFGLEVIFNGNLIESLKLSEQEVRELASRISGTIIGDINVPNDHIVIPNHQYTNLELERLTGERDYMGVFYDGYWLQRIFFKSLRAKAALKITNTFIHIMFTSRLFGTFEKRRYHARVILMGTPTLISTSGVVEAPARPREYYWLKAGFIQSGRDIGELDSVYRGRFIDYNDSKITPILGSYALQAVAYELSGKEFCEDKACCLYNSHWQEEVLKAQLAGRLCQEHHDIISGISVTNQTINNRND